MNIEVAQGDATFFYPAVSDAELASEQLLLTNYRRSMGHTRMLWAALGLGAVWWFSSYVRALPPPR